MPRTLRSWALLLALLPCALALNPARALSQFHKRNWQVEDGLPRNYVMSVGPSGDGYLLIGTEEGLARFDGVRFVPFDLDPSLGLSRRWIGTLIRSRAGSLWVGTFDGWIYEYRQGQVATRFNAGVTVFALLEDAQGRIWASTRTGVIRSAAGSFQPVPGLSGPPATAWNVLAIDNRGVVWVVTDEGLHSVRKGTTTRVLPRQSRFGDLLAVRFTRSGILFLGASRGLFTVDPLSGTTNPAAAAQISGPVVEILEDHDGVVWVSSWGKGLYRLRGSQVDSWSARDGLPDNFIRTLHEDPEGNLWIGTRGGGLIRWKDTPLIPFGLSEGLGGDFATTVAPAPDDHLWFGTWRGGLYRLGENGFEPRPTPVPALYCAVRALAIDPAGHPWIGNWEGLFGFDGQRYRNYAQPGSPYSTVSALLFDRQRRLWLATANNGVFLFPPGPPLRPAASFLPGVEITALHEDAQGRIWYATPQGLGSLDVSRGERAVPITGLPQGPVSAITSDSKGRIWATTLAGSLYLVAPGSPIVIGAAHGLPGLPLYRLLDDRAGALWISTAKGILRIPTAQVDELLAGKRQRLDAAVFDQSEGMRTPECHHTSQPAGWTDPRGGVWFPTTRGFVRTVPDRTDTTTPPEARLEGATWDQHTVPPGATLVLDPGLRPFEIRYTALRFASAENIRFRYRMEGVDSRWIDAGTQRTARYGGLPPGDYRFLVSASLPGGAWSSPPASLAVRQLPLFRQTGAFLALLALTSLTLAALLFRWRIHIVKGRYSAVLAERHRIAREWHDTLLAGFAAISWQLQETLSRLKEMPDQAQSTVEVALKMVQHYRAEARSVIWDLRESRPASETLAAAVSSALAQLSEDSPILATASTSGEPRRLDEELERNVLRICQEAASNAKRHAHPSRISILLAYRPDGLHIHIQDDGAGFFPARAIGLTSGHFGLAVMQERAERFGGRLSISSQPGQGTIVEVSIPYSSARMK